MKVRDWLIMKRRKGKSKNCSLYTNLPLQNVMWPYVVCRVMLGKVSENMYKSDLGWVYMFLVSGYIATFCDG